MHPLGLVWAGVTAMVVAVAALRPSWFELARLGQEGPVEHLAHLVLLVAAVAWGACFAAVMRAPGPRRLAAALVTVYVALLFVEEIDWGAVYGLGYFSDGLHDMVGLHSLHQNRARPDSMFGDKLLWFAVPSVVWFGVWRLPMAPIRGWSGALVPLTPSPSESRWFFGAIAAYTLLDPFIRHDLLDLFQMLAYVVIGWSGLRSARVLLVSGAEAPC